MPADETTLIRTTCDGCGCPLTFEVGEFEPLCEMCESREYQGASDHRPPDE